MPADFKAFLENSSEKTTFFSLAERERRRDTTFNSLQRHQSLGNSAPVLKPFSLEMKPFRHDGKQFSPDSIRTLTWKQHLLQEEGCGSGSSR